VSPRGDNVAPTIWTCVRIAREAVHLPGATSLGNCLKATTATARDISGTLCVSRSHVLRLTRAATATRRSKRMKVFAANCSIQEMENNLRILRVLRNFGPFSFCNFSTLAHNFLSSGVL
jgi:hypothetical protein